MYDIFESQVEELSGLYSGRPELLKELNLDVSTGELLSAERAFSYANLYAMLENEKTVAWLTPYTAVVRADGREVEFWGELYESCRVFFNADGEEMVALARSPQHLLEICDVVLRLLAASVVHSVTLQGLKERHYMTRHSDGESINATSLEYLMEQCQSLKSLSLIFLDMHENHCRVLGTYSRPGLEIELSYCRIAGAASEALAEVLGRNQGPTKLDHCEADNFVLANGLRGNSRLQNLTLSVSEDFDVGRRQVFAIAGALEENKGLVGLNIWYHLKMRGEPWGAVCDSLKTHPTLQVLHLRTSDASAGGPLYPAAIPSRMQALLDMMKVNTSIHTIHLNTRDSNHELFQGSVIPYLETNLKTHRLRPRLLAIQNTRPIAYRSKVLGRALLAVRTDPNRFWMLLSGNSEVAFPSTTTTTAPVANLPMSATAADTITATRAAFPTGASSAVIVATPTTSQKR
jgi:hypothetical protein